MNKEYIQPKIYHGFLTNQECDDIIKISIKKGFINSQINSHQITASRKSRTCWLSLQEYPLDKIIYKKKIENKKKKYRMEDLQVVHYRNQEYFVDHYDQCNPKNWHCIKDMEKFQGPRLFTLLIYLNHPSEYEGGYTVFPHLGQRFKGEKGTAILFYNLDQSEKYIHPKSLHRGEPIEKGEKWICNVWFH
jgi:prolyl 4-hydroxylase